MMEFATPKVPKADWEIVRVGVFQYQARCLVEGEPFTRTAIVGGRIRTKRLRPPRRYRITLGPFLTRGYAKAAVAHLTGA